METILWLLLGVASAIGFILFARNLGREGEARVLAAGLVIAALVYVVFGVSARETNWILLELAGLLLFSIVAVLGLKRSALWLAAGWAGHPLWDAWLHLGDAGGASFTPRWYVLACIGFDLLVAGYILLMKQRR
ncbi:MAG TPA: DUF6010 family protein [Pyrinomonadaceae bacterium]